MKNQPVLSSGGWLGMFFSMFVLVFFETVIAQNTHTLVNGSPRFPGSFVINTNGDAGIDPHPGARSGAAIAYYEGKIFLFGGATLPAKYPYGPGDATNDLWQYNPLYDVWQKWTNHHFYWGGPSSCGPDYGLPSGPLYTNAKGPSPAAGAIMAGYSGYGDNGSLFVAGTDEKRLWRFDLLRRYWDVNWNEAKNQPQIGKNLVSWVHNNQWFVLGPRSATDTCTALSAELWVLDFATMTWTQRHGAGGCNPHPVYGTLGVASPTNHPGARLRATATMYNGEAYLFGGEGYGTNGKGMLNDIWVYNFNTNQWRWVGGSMQAGAAGVAGNRESFAPQNQPSGRAGSALFANNGRLYVQGGQQTAGGIMADMWAFDTASKQWSWWRGDTLKNQPGVFGVRKQAAANVYPGGKYAMSYFTINNKFYVQGGHGIDSAGQGTINYSVNEYNSTLKTIVGVIKEKELITSDIWQYDPATGQWAWNWGDANMQMSGRYGTQGVWSTSNIPGPRKHAVSWQWLRKFYLFGGYGYDSRGKLGYLNDLWEWNTATNQWRWLSGADTCNAINQISGANAYPGGREQGINWVHEGKLWLMGGNRVGADGQMGVLSDMWQYDPALQRWAYKGGTDEVNAQGSFGDTAVFAAGNWPPSRLQPAMWAQRGRLYLYGGESPSRSDLWEYDISTTQWRWLAGEKEIGVQYLYVPNYSSYPAWQWPSPGYSFIGRAYWQYGRQLAFSYLNNNNVSWTYDLDSSKWRYINSFPGLSYFGILIFKYRNFGLVQMGNSIAFYGGFGDNYHFLGCDLRLRAVTYADNFSITPTSNYYESGTSRSGLLLDPAITYNGNSNPLLQNIGGRADMAAWWLPGSMYLFGGEGIDASQRVGLLGDTWRIRLQPKVPPVAASTTIWIPDIYQTPDIATADPAIVATVWPTNHPAVLGSIEVGLKLWQNAQAYGSKWVIRRGIDIQSFPQQAAATTRITFYATQADFDNYNTLATGGLLPAAAGDAAGKSRLRVSQLLGVSSDSSGLPGTYPGPENFIDPADADIVWNSEDERWEISFEATGFGGFFVHASDRPLAVSQFTLQAMPVQQQVKLVWKIAGSSPVRAFEIERSADGQHWQQQFTQALSVPQASGSFSYTDMLEAGSQQQLVWYYRIAALHTDGSRTLSPVRQVQLSGICTMQLLQNPASSLAVLAFYNTHQQTVQLKLLDITGRIVKSASLVLPAGSTRYNWAIGGLAAGQYLIHAEANGIQLVPLKLQKQ